jgi:hypothetical protein
LLPPLQIQPSLSPPQKPRAVLIKLKDELGKHQVPLLDCLEIIDPRSCARPLEHSESRHLGLPS